MTIPVGAAPLAFAATSHATRAVVLASAALSADEWITTNVGPISAKYRMRGGSGWSACAKYTAGGQELFVKSSVAHDLSSMYLGEALGLKALSEAGHHSGGSLTIPSVLRCADGPESGSYIIMEYLDVCGRPDLVAFGRAMAELHLATPRHAEAKAGRFGFPVDNTIGATFQPNGWIP